MTALWEVLIAAAGLETCRRLASILSQWGFEPICSSTVGKAKAILARQAVPMVFCEDRLADGSFRDVLGAVGLLQSKARVVVTSPAEEGNGYLDAIQHGAFDVIPCACRPSDVHRVILRAMREDGEKLQSPTFSEAHEVKAFYDRWNASVFRFCYLFLGNKDLASECTREAFLNYLREKPVFPTSALPPRLMSFALAAVRRGSTLDSRASRPNQICPENVLCIPSDQRTVFIMRSMLGMSDSSVASATGLPMERLRGLWRRSLFNLREILPREFFERVISGRHVDLATLPEEFLFGGEKPSNECR